MKKLSRAELEQQGFRFVPWSDCAPGMQHDNTIRDMINEGFLHEVPGGVMEKPTGLAPLLIGGAVCFAAYWLYKKITKG